MNTALSAYRWLADSPHHRTGIAVLQRAIGAALLFRVFTEGPFASFLWGPHGIGYGSLVRLVGVPGVFGDAMFTSEIGTRLVLAGLTCGALGLLFQIRTRLATLLALVTFTMITERLPDLGDGGDNMTGLVLIYLLFAMPANRPTREGSLSVWVHNVAVLAIGAQLAVLYFISGFMKMNGAVWHPGTALYSISQVEWFSIPTTRELFKNPVFATLATYSTMMFQVWFPVGIFSRFRLAFIAVGIFFHIGIAVSMGLLTFSTVMIGLELFLVQDEQYERLKAGLVRLASRLRSMVVRPAPAPAPEVALYIDGWCPSCTRAGRLVAALDVTRRVQIASFRHTDDYIRYGISADALEKRMHVVRVQNGTVAAGFEAVRALASALPPLWPLRPIFAVVAAARLGDRVYDALAARRSIIPDARACDDRCFQEKTG